MSNSLPHCKREQLLDTNQASARHLEHDSNFNELCKHREFGPQRTKRALDAAEKFIRARTEMLVNFALEEWKL